MLSEPVSSSGSPPSSKAQDRRSLTLSLDLPLGPSSNFPSPSSSFLPPPIPGADEFAVKKPPKGRGSRKGSIAPLLLGDDEPARKISPSDTPLGPSNGKDTKTRSSGNNRSRCNSGDASVPTAVSTTTNPTSFSSSSPAPTVNGKLNPTKSIPIMPMSPSPTTPKLAISSARSSVSSDSTTSLSIKSPALYSQNATPTTAFPQAGYPQASTPGAGAVGVAPPLTPLSAKRLSAQSSRSNWSTPPQSPSSSSFAMHSTNRLSKRLSSGLPQMPMTPSRMYYQLQQRNDSTTSLQSNRPAPPSPALSRRTSGVGGVFSPSTSPAIDFYRRSDSPSSIGPVGGGGGLERNNSGKILAEGGGLRRKSSGLSKDLMSGVVGESPDIAKQRKRPKSISTTAVIPPTPAVTPQQRKWNPIIVRDFGFDEDDERSKGLGSNCPKANRLRTLNKPLYVNRASVMSAMTTASSTTSSKFKFDVDDETSPIPPPPPIDLQSAISTGDTGSKLGLAGFDIPGFKWGRWSWALKRDVEEAVHHHPSLYSPTEDEDEEDEPEEVDILDDDEEEDEDGLLGSEEPLYPGLYRSLYSFEPEKGSAEMKLDEGQVVRVVGRGGGPGWVVVVDEGDQDATEAVVVLDGDPAQDGERKEKHALVPESYLEIVELDEWEEDEEAEAEAAAAKGDMKAKEQP